MILTIAATLIIYDNQRWNFIRDMRDEQCVELAMAFVEAGKVGQTRPVRINWACQADDGKWLTPKLFSEIDP